MEGENSGDHTVRDHIYRRRLWKCVRSEAWIIAGQLRGAISAPLGSPTPQQCCHTDVQTDRGSGEDEDGEGAGVQSGAVEWLEQLLVKDLSKPITSVPFISAETGEGLTQTCLHRTDCSLHWVCVYACMRVCFASDIRLRRPAVPWHTPGYYLLLMI